MSIYCMCRDWYSLRLTDVTVRWSSIGWGLILHEADRWSSAAGIDTPQRLTVGHKQRGDWYTPPRLAAGCMAVVMMRGSSCSTSCTLGLFSGEKQCQSNSHVFNHSLFNYKNNKTENAPSCAFSHNFFTCSKAVEFKEKSLWMQKSFCSYITDYLKRACWKYSMSVTRTIHTVWPLLVQYSMSVARTIQYECYSYNTVWVLLVKYSMSVTRTIQYECYSCNTVWVWVWVWVLIFRLRNTVYRYKLLGNTVFR